MFYAVPNIMCVVLVLLCHTAHAQQDTSHTPNVLIIVTKSISNLPGCAVAELKGRQTLLSLNGQQTSYPTRPMRLHRSTIY